MNVVTNPTSLPPLIQTHTKVIERGAIGVKTFASGSEYRHMLRCQVENLPKFHFTPASFLLCFLTFSDVDHSSDKFNEMTGCIQNRMTYDVNVPDGATRMHDAIFGFPLCLVVDGCLDYFSEAGLVVGMNPLKELFESRQTILCIETEYTVAFLRPVPNIVVWTPCPTSCLAEPLRLRQIRFASSDLFLGALLFTQVENKHDALVWTLHPRSSNQNGHAAAVFPDIL